MREFNPAPLEYLQERYTRAVDHVHTGEDETSALVETAHTFDFEDGLRLVIFLMDSERGGRFLIVLPSYQPGCLFDRRLEQTLASFPEANRTGEAWHNLLAYGVIFRFEALAGKRAVQLVRDEGSVRMFAQVEGG